MPHRVRVTDMGIVETRTFTSGAELVANYARIRQSLYPVQRKPIAGIPAPHTEAVKKTISAIPTQHNEHVKAFQAWRAMTGEDMTGREYFRALCWLSGHSVEKIQSKEECRPLAPTRRAIVRSLGWRFKRLSGSEISKIVNRDHTTVFFWMSQTARGEALFGRPIRRRERVGKYTNSRTRALIRKMREEGEELKAISVATGFTVQTIMNVLKRHGHHAKLTEEQVLIIKRIMGDFKNAELARQYDVSVWTIMRVRNGQRWAHVTPEGATE